MTIYRVEHNAEGDWLPAVREDLYDGTNDEVLERTAEFATPEDAEQFIHEIRGLIHCGGSDIDFRVVKQSQPSTDSDAIGLPLGTTGDRS
jgi:hypothetical protein